MTIFSQKLAKIFGMGEALALAVALFIKMVVPLPVFALELAKIPSVSQKTTTIALVAPEPVATPVEVVVPEAPKPDKKIAAVFTAYTSTPDQTDSDPFIAAGGKRVYKGMVANNCLPLGTKLKLTFADEQMQEKYGDVDYMVDDRMNSRYGCNRFDIWLDAPRKEAMQFGVRRATVEVYFQKKIAKAKSVKKVKIVELAEAK